MKYCPNCGKEMSGEFCSNCGYPKSNNTTINRDELLNAYASKNANKVYNRRWNWSAFFFGPVYYLYRKMWIEGLILLILNYIVNNFISNGIVSFILVIVIGVVASLLFSKLYTKKANHKIDLILSTNPSRDQALLECQRRGGTAVWVAVIVGLIYGFALIIFIAALAIMPMVKERNCEEAICNADRSECYTLDENGSIDWEGSCN